MKISIITVCFNSAETIGQTLQSVSEQSYNNIEHIVVDGGSIDNTLKIIEIDGNHISKIISEPDEGIYDAMNKGLSLSSGDIVGFLNSDDTYADAVILSDVVKKFELNSIDFVYGDIIIKNNNGETVRYWRTGEISKNKRWVGQIPHPAFFVRRSVLNLLNPAFDSSYNISADLKQQLILINKHGVRGSYLQRTLVHMSIGGASTRGIRNYIIGWKESVRAYNEVFGSGGWWYTVKKISSKIRGIRNINQFHSR